VAGCRGLSLAISYDDLARKKTTVTSTASADGGGCPTAPTLTESIVYDANGNVVETSGASGVSAIRVTATNRYCK